MLSIHQKIRIGVSSFGHFLMKGRREAAIAAMITAAIPFLGWASLAIVCLVTLRKGMREGLFVLCWGVLPAAVSSYLMASGSVALESLIAYIFLWVMAGLLRATASWRYVFEASAIFSVVIIALFHFLIPDLNEIYLNYLMSFYQDSGVDSENYAQMQIYIQYLVYYFLGLQTTMYMMHNLFCLLIARGFQAVLYNPQGLSKDLKMIRLGWLVWIFAAVFFFFGVKMSSPWALDTFPVFIALFFFSGLSVIHYWINMKFSKLKGSMLIFYVFLTLLLPFSIVPVMLMALVDTGWNIRKNLTRLKEV